MAATVKFTITSTPQALPGTGRKFVIGGSEIEWSFDAAMAVTNRVELSGGVNFPAATVYVKTTGTSRHTVTVNSYES